MKAALGAVVALALLGCAGTDFAQAAGAPAFPSGAQIAQTRAYLGTRSGRHAYAVIDSTGRLHGSAVHSRFVTASVVKAMLLVEYLRMLDAQGRGLSGADRAILGPMIQRSDNKAATAIWLRVGDFGLYRFAQVAGMTDFTLGPRYISSCRCSGGGWARAQISAADQARLFYRLDELLPARFRDYAKNLFETVIPAQSWGIPEVARPLGWRVFFKVGLRKTGLGGLIHQAARLEDGTRTIAIAVMTDGDPSFPYGKQTVAGVAQALLKDPV